MPLWVHYDRDSADENADHASRASQETVRHESLVVDALAANVAVAGDVTALSVNSGVVGEEKVRGGDAAQYDQTPANKVKVLETSSKSRNASFRGGNGLKATRSR